MWNTGHYLQRLLIKDTGLPGEFFMKKQQRIEYSQLETGYELSQANYKMEPAMVAAYLRAVQEHSELYEDRKLVPPMASATYAMAALSENIFYLPGSNTY